MAGVSSLQNSSKSVTNANEQHAQRMHNLGQSSKESWIKRLWNHVFGPEDDNSGFDDNLAEGQKTNDQSSSVLRERPTMPAVLPPIGSSNSKEGQRKNVDKNGTVNKNGTVDKGNSLKTSEDHIEITNIEQSIGNDYNKQKSVGFTADHKSLSLPTIHGVPLPAQFHNSPYLPAKERTMHRLPRLQDSESPTRSQTSSASTIAKLSKSNTTLGVSDLEKSYQGSANGDMIVKKQQLLQPIMGDEKRDTKSRVSRSVSIIQLERRAKAVTDKALKSGKIFTCFAPYPVDAFVRHSLRKRGWVEKFGTRILNELINSSTTSHKFQCSTDEDFEIICDQSIPKPWEEDNGIYSIMSRQVSRSHPKFIWGNKSVNNLVLRNDVIVNHFPKAKYFNSKVLLAESLRELHWQNNSTSTHFFPRCYLLKESEENDIIDDFRTTACTTLLRIVVHQANIQDIGSNGGSNKSRPNSAKQSKDSSKNLNTVSKNSSDVNGNTRNASVNKNDWHSRQKSGINFENKTSRNNLYPDDSSIPDMRDHTFEEELDHDLPDNVSSHILYSKFGPPKVIPDLELDGKQKKGGTIPQKAVLWALHHCDLFVRAKNHEDIDKNRRGLTFAQWEQFLTWFQAASQEGATISVSQEQVNDCLNMLQRMESVWPQMEIEGLHNIWIVKPGAKSKGIGIKFCTKLEDIIEYVRNPETPDYVVQKYIERPLLIYNCKFDVRQWFLVTEWQPLTVWFYKISYLRICSQEFTYNTLHESVHLSNVAVQENYINGNRSEKLPDNNFLTSEQFREYLSEVGAEGVWENKIYPGMKEAVLNTLIATQEITDSRKSGFELYGADFMMSEDYNPWLLEVNSSPGMLPSSIEKAKLCAAVIEDTIKVVLDHKENSACDTGRFELIYRDTVNPNTRGSDCKLLLEGNRIARTELQKYSLLDQNTTKLLEEYEAKLRAGEEKIMSEYNKEEAAEEFSRFQRNVRVSEGVIIQSISRLSNTTSAKNEDNSKSKGSAKNNSQNVKDKGKEKKNQNNAGNKIAEIYGSAGSGRSRPSCQQPKRGYERSARTK